MGCDIHFYVERREGDAWVSCDTWKKDTFDDDRLHVGYNDLFYNGRNYDLFAILADVRNGYGFAGCDTGDGFKPIAPPRGLPDDANELVRNESGTWGADGHSHSHFTVAELLAYDWTQTTTKRAWVDGPNYHAWMLRRAYGGGPESYCGGISGRDIEHVSEEELKRRIDKLVQAHSGRHWDATDDVKRSLNNVWANISWQTPYYRAASEFLSGTMPKLWRLGKPEDVRIVFWFDN